MATFQCLIEATKGNQKSYYHATVEEDGFVYFNDKSFYRVETPQNLIQDLENNQMVTITGGIQYWYVVRDIWVYANRFDQLELSMPPEFDKQAVQTAINTVNYRLNLLGSDSILTNGQALYQLREDVWDMARDLNTQGVSVSYPSYPTIYRSWSNWPDVVIP